MLDFLAQNIYLFYSVVLLTSVLSASFGVGSFVLIPLAAIVFGSKEAIGIITIYFLFQNINKIIVFRKHIDRGVALKMVLWSIPGAIVGSFALSFIPLGVFNKVLAVFILAYLANDVFEFIPKKHYSVSMIPLFGTLYGFMSGLVGSGNLVKGPLFTSIGLLKESYIGTYAVTSFFVNVPKILVYMAIGVIVGSTFVKAIPFLFISIVGTYIGKHFLSKVPNDIFYYILNIFFAISAVVLLFGQSIS